MTTGSGTDCNGRYFKGRLLGCGDRLGNCDRGSGEGAEAGSDALEKSAQLLGRLKANDATVAGCFKPRGVNGDWSDWFTGVLSGSIND